MHNTKLKQTKKLLHHGEIVTWALEMCLVTWIKYTIIRKCNTKVSRWIDGRSYNNSLSFFDICSLRTASMRSVFLFFFVTFFQFFYFRDEINDSICGGVNAMFSLFVALVSCVSVKDLYALTQNASDLRAKQKIHLPHGCKANEKAQIILRYEHYLNWKKLWISRKKKKINRR